MRQFAVEHIAALIVTAISAGLLVRGARRHGDAWAARVGRGLALCILVAYLTEHLTYALRGEWTTRVNLPLQLTDAVTLVSVAALWFPRATLLVELLYYWALSGSLQAVLTPDLGQGFPDALYFSYFATHSGALLAACLLVFGCRRLPRPGAVWRVYGLTAAFAALAAIGTVLTGGNYMFLRRKPAHGSLLDVMGPWPWYILAAAALGLVMFLALDALARARPEPSVTA
ncbi:MAG: TIGR02206 family membrane protein [Actinomycetota bacterium]|nr:TIGR02206 family membrane protein [Actinomycetota bacterium]